MKETVLGTTLLAVSTVLTLLAAEVALRWIDGFAVTPLRLQAVSPRGLGHVGAERHLDRLPLARGVERAWFFEDPPAPRAQPPPPGLEERYWRHRGRELTSIYVWNRAFVTLRTCSNGGDFYGLDDVFVFTPPDNQPHPTFRFQPSMRIPSGLVTNAFGWRGPEVTLEKRPSTIRIAFVGASTTVANHGYPLSYPEFIGYWLGRWAKARGGDVGFEVINAGREGTASTDFAAIVRTELLPLDPDLVVYYEGSNQFWPANYVQWPGGQLPKRPTLTLPQRSWLEDHSALARRTRTLWRSASARRGRSASARAGRELPRRIGTVSWPPGLDEQDPDLRFPDLPVNLNTILRDLEDIRTTLGSSGSELAMSSFVWLVQDGMVLDPARHWGIYAYLHQTFWPFPYAHMRRFADFQNRVFRKYAHEHQLPFIDIAALYPQDPDLFGDAIHMTEEGTRLHAWIAFETLVPVLEARIAEGKLPRRPRSPSPRQHPAFQRTPQLVSVRELARDCLTRSN